jgi:hypothetical protein
MEGETDIEEEKQRGRHAAIKKEQSKQQTEGQIDKLTDIPTDTYTDT